MGLLKKARVAVGVMSAITLFILFGAEALLPGTTLNPRTIYILLSMISAMLAVDILSQHLPIEVKLKRREKNND